jgi:hypothetical protein
VELPGVGTKQLVLNIDGEQTRRSEALPCAIDLEMGPRSLALIEVI